MSALDDAFAVLDGEGDVVGARDEALVAAAEAALGLRFPPSYRQFLRRYGAGGIGAFEVYGVVEEPFEGPVPDGVWMTLDARPALPATAVVLGDDGMGGLYVLDTAHGDDPPVEVRSGDESELVAPSFADWLLDGVQAELEA